MSDVCYFKPFEIALLALGIFEDATKARDWHKRQSFSPDTLQESIDTAFQAALALFLGTKEGLRDSAFEDLKRSIPPEDYRL